MIQPNRYSCMATAFAIIWDIPVEKIFDIVGHDGTPTVAGIHRGFHIEEMKYAGIKLGHAVLLHKPKQYYPGTDILLPFNKWQEITDLWVPGVLRIVLRSFDHAIARLDCFTWIDPTTGEKFPNVRNYEWAEYYSSHKI